MSISKFYDFLHMSLKEVVSNNFFVNTKGIIENVEGFLGLQYNDIGISFNFNADGLVSSIFIDQFYKHKQKKALFPFEIRFSDTYNDIYKKVGKPNKSTRGVRVPVLGKMPDSDIYYFDNYSMAVVYNDNLDSIRRITFMTPDATPGRNVQRKK